MLYAGLRLGKILGEQLPRSVEHLVYLDVDIDAEEPYSIFLGVVQAAEVIVGEVETVLQLGLGVLGVGIEADACVHDLAVVLARLLALDELFQTVTQNSFLKLSEEPPQDVFFILLCKNAQRMLNTILSRFTVISLRGEEQFDEAELEAARKIAQGILENREYPLLLALNALTDEEAAPRQIISALKLSLRDALALLSGGDVIGDGETAKQLASRLTRKKIMDMIELCGSSLNKLKQNVNINLLTTWMCGEFRRITWQR